jgi:capsular polysaccharide biosynthesis protein
MKVEDAARARRGTRVSELEPEEELDLREYGRSLALRWWLIVGATVLGAVIGWLLAVGGGDVWRARTTIYLGQPIAPTGEAQVQSAATNPSTAGVIARSDEVIDEVAGEVDVSPGKLRAGVSTKPIEGAITRLGQTPLVEISVRGPWGRDTVEQGANLIAAAVTERISGYVTGKIGAFEEQIAAQEDELATLDERIVALEGSRNIDVIALLAVLEQRRGDLRAELADTREALAVAQNVEAASVLTEARGSKVSARSSRSSVIVGALIGLLVGCALALLWVPLQSRLRRADT